MSTRPSKHPERRRKPDDVRRAALEAARRLLIASGPGAITLKAIGAALGMSHANLIHHFGSAEGLRTQLRDLMVQDLTRTTTRLLEQYRGGEDAGGTILAMIVDRVFETYASGGIGMLMAWTSVSGMHGPADDMAAALRELVALLAGRLDGADPGGRAREMVSLVTLLAFANSLIGNALAAQMGGEALAMRALTVRLLGALDPAPA